MPDPTTVQDPTVATVVKQTQPKKNQAGTWQGATREIAEELATLKDEFSALSALIIAFMSGKGAVAPAPASTPAPTPAPAPAIVPAPALSLVVTPVAPAPTMTEAVVAKLKALWEKIPGGGGDGATIALELCKELDVTRAEDMRVRLVRHEAECRAIKETRLIALLDQFLTDWAPNDVQFDDKPYLSKIAQIPAIAVPARAAAQKPVKRSILRGLILRR